MMADFSRHQLKQVNELRQEAFATKPPPESDEEIALARVFEGVAASLRDEQILLASARSVHTLHAIGVRLQDDRDKKPKSLETAITSLDPLYTRILKGGAGGMFGFGATKGLPEAVRARRSKLDRMKEVVSEVRWIGSMLAETDPVGAEGDENPFGQQKGEIASRREF